MARIALRQLEDREYETTAALLAAICPDHRQRADEWRHADQQSNATQTPLRRFVAVEETNLLIVGYGAFWCERLDKFRIELVVVPEWRRQGTGNLLFVHMMGHLSACGASTVQARTPEDARQAIDFLLKRDFVITQRMQELRLDIRQVDFSRLAQFATEVGTPGFVISTLKDEQETGLACWSKLLTLQNSVLPGWPDPDPGPIQEMTLARLQDRIKKWSLIPEAFFIMKHGEQYVGYSGLAGTDRPGELSSIVTAVRRDYRNCGVASALKGHAIRFVQQQGYNTISAHSANPAMIHVNEKLGFRCVSAELRLVRQLVR